MGEEQLTPRERRVLGLVTGTIDGHQRQVEWVARRLGTTPQRIEEILAAARSKLDE